MNTQLEQNSTNVESIARILELFSHEDVRAAVNRLPMMLEVNRREGNQITKVDEEISANEGMTRVNAERSRQVLEIVQGGFKIVEKENGYRFRLELLDRQREQLSPLEYRAVAESIKRMNFAVAEGHLALTPGVDSLRLINVAKGMEALVPGMYTTSLNNAGFFSTVSGQWFPPGITIELTPKETANLIFALAGGGILTGVVGLEFLPALVISAILVIEATVLTAMVAASSTGAIGFKITIIPPLNPVAIPYPI